jgi:HAE1 family hydrophobic/amphiphilic exporter-1
MISCQLQDGASLAETMDVMDRAVCILDSIPGVQSSVAISGMSLTENAQISSKGTMFVVLKDWEERTDEAQSIGAIIARFNKEASLKIEDAVLYAFPMPAIQGLGNSGGFECYVQDKGNLGVLELQRTAEDLAAQANLQAPLKQVRSSFKATVPQVFLHIDREQVKQYKLAVSDVFSTLSAYLGSSYANDFVLFGKVYQVKVQAESQNRSVIEDVLKLSVRNQEGKMVPLGAFTTIEHRLGTEVIARYNMYPAAYVSGDAADGYSSGQAQSTMAQLAQESMPGTFGFEWTSMAYQEQQAGSSTVIIFALALVVVLMVLAAQYESVTSPMAVIMAVPVALLGIIAACFIAGRPMDIYTQIGMVLMIALSAKNAILIVEFARDFRKEGKTIYESCVEAGMVRLRPILMTSFAFILGVVPLVTATGAGAESRVSLGLSVFAGMLMSTIVGTLIIPNFYQFWQKVQEKRLEGKKNVE